MVYYTKIYYLVGWGPSQDSGTCSPRIWWNQSELHIFWGVSLQALAETEKILCVSFWETSPVQSAWMESVCEPQWSSSVAASLEDLSLDLVWYKGYDLNCSTAALVLSLLVLSCQKMKLCSCLRSSAAFNRFSPPSSSHGCICIWYICIVFQVYICKNKNTKQLHGSKMCWSIVYNLHQIHLRFKNVSKSLRGMNTFGRYRLFKKRKRKKT